MRTAIKYPKLFALCFTFLLAYFIFGGKELVPFHSFLASLGYAGTFITGIFFSYGFTAAPATAVLLILSKTQDVFVAGVVGGLGALAGDYAIFNLLRTSFADEISEIRNEKLVMKIGRAVPSHIKKYLVPVFAGLIIASPLPDEIGVSMLVASQDISTKKFALISFALNTAGIIVVLSIGKGIA